MRLLEIVTEETTTSVRITVNRDFGGGSVNSTSPILFILPPHYPKK
jgi:hypothetical protein